MSTLAAPEVTNEQSTQEFDRLFNHSYVLAASAEKPQIYIPEKGPFTEQPFWRRLLHEKKTSKAKRYDALK